MADVSGLNQAVTDLVGQVTSSVGVENSATTLINGFEAIAAQKIADALKADNAADQGSIDAAVAALAEAKQAMLNSSGPLAAAITANSGA